MIAMGSPEVLQTAGSNISYFIEGNRSKAASLYFLNGMYRGKESWIKQIRSKKLRENYRMLFMDYPGFGGTDLWNGDRDYVKLVVENIYSIIKKENEKKINLIGYSLGGAFACQFASLHPEKMNSLILINSGFNLSSYMKVIVRQSLKLLQSEIDFSMIYPYISVWHYSEDYLEKIVDMGDFRKSSAYEYIKSKKALRDMLHIADQLYSYRECAERIKCPVLALCGEQDMVLPYARQHELFQNREGFETKIISGASHSAILENFKEVNICMEEFLCKYNG